jgi:hypothetical protein
VSFDNAHDAKSITSLNVSADNNAGFYEDEIRSDTADHDTLCLSGYPISSIVEVSDVFRPGIWDRKEAVAAILQKY